MTQGPALRDQRWATLGRLLGFGWIVVHRRVVAKVRARGFDDLADAHFALTRCMDYGGTRVSELARRAGASKQAMSSLASSMESMGYVQRCPDPTDGRAVLVRYTRRGMSLARTLVEAARETEEELRALAGDETVGELKRALGAFLDAAMPGHEAGWA
ncbi:MAG: MarR family transcriptional regulator [Phycisphaeraceae bacterium]|nr:MarR family transcriptional regulator [Phycisphaeraceae bacterium]